MRRSLALAFALLVLAAFTPPNPNPAAVPSGTYVSDSAHTQVLFSVMHLGITPFHGEFSNVSGALAVTQGAPRRDTLQVTVPIASLYTSSARLTQELRGPAWLDAQRYKTMTFKSTAVSPTGANTADVAGELTLHGVTRPVVLHATFVAGGINPLLKKRNIGFTVTGTISRAAFGVATAEPLVGDQMTLTISAAFVIT